MDAQIHVEDRDRIGLEKRLTYASMKKSHPVRNLKRVFIQDWGTYTNQTLVVLGMNRKQIVHQLKRFGVKKDFKDWIEKNGEFIDENIAREDKGFFAHNNGGSILWLKGWDNTWGAGEVLLHELHHAVHFILGQSKGMLAECEAMAYQQEWLFRTIRRRLTNLTFKK